MYGTSLISKTLSQDDSILLKLSRIRRTHHANLRLPGKSGENQENDSHPLVQIGIIFKEEVDTKVGNAIIRAGEFWSVGEWGGVTECLKEASTALRYYVVQNTEVATTETFQLWQSIAQDLDDISTIEGCSSIGPAASIPNWISIEVSLERVSATGTLEEEMDIEVLRNVAIEVNRLVTSI
jgi:hypothetical protein